MMDILYLSLHALECAALAGIYWKLRPRKLAPVVPIRRDEPVDATSRRAMRLSEIGRLMERHGVGRKEAQEMFDKS